MSVEVLGQVLDRPAAAAEEPLPAVQSVRPGSERAGLSAVTGTALVLNTWALSLNGLGNQYYAAAARSMSASWRNFFFVALDPGGFISIDKPPVALWVHGVSARLFGINSWSLLLPSALAGTGAVALLWCTVRRRFGTLAANVAGLVLAVSPVNVAVNRLNLPEPWLALFLVAAAWAVLRGLEAARPVRWMVLAGAFVGLAFNTKMLAGYVAVPALAAAVALGARNWRRRITHVIVLGTACVAFSVPWQIAVDLTPPSSRPYVGGSTDNTVLDLVFGYNGFGRVEGDGGPAGRGGAPVGGFAAAGGVFGGEPGAFRMFSDAVGGQVAWLLPMGALGIVAGAWQHRRDRRRMSAVVLWAGWLGLYAVVFSYARGTFHSYYVSMLVPALAAVIGIGAAALLRLVRRSPGWLAAVAVAGAATALLQLELIWRQPEFHPWTRWVLAALALGATAAVLSGVLRRRAAGVLGGLAAGLAALLVAPAVWSVSETANPVLNATLPQAGPRSGVAGGTFGSASSNGDPALAEFLRGRHTTETWDLVTSSVQSAAGLIADEAISVMALGGFMGTDPATDLAEVAGMVDRGEVRWFLVDGFGTGFGRGTSAGTILATVQQACAPVTSASTDGDLPSQYDGRIYDCAGHAAALLGT